MPWCCRGTTGPNSINPETGRPWGRDFPAITVADQVEVQRRLIDHLGIGKLLAVLGGSMGGHQVLAWASRLSDRVEGVIPVATSPRLTSQALAFDVVGRNAILRDPSYHDGQYYDRDDRPDVGLALARMLAHVTYLSPESMTAKFDRDRHLPRDIQTEFEKKFSVGSYLAYQGERFVEIFDANSYLTLSLAMDLFDIGQTREEIAGYLEDSDCRYLVMSFTSDWLFPSYQSRQIVSALVLADKPVSYCEVESICGHDAFLLPNDLDRYGTLVRAFLAGLSDEPELPPEEVPEEMPRRSMFHVTRMDVDRILDLIPPDASVLDLGCGDGELLQRLRRRGHQRTVGLELDEQAVLQSVRRGVDVIHADLNRGLRHFRDKHFDYVVLSLTLQQVMDVKGLLGELVRVGRRGIVGFPNFGYYKLRSMLAEDGRAPSSAGVLRYNWYDTPNIRFFTLRDFEELCDEMGIEVLRRIGLDTENQREVTEDLNLNADVGIFVVSG